MQQKPLPEQKIQKQRLSVSDPDIIQATAPGELPDTWIRLRRLTSRVYARACCRCCCVADGDCPTSRASIALAQWPYLHPRRRAVGFYTRLL
jgi:hypothetical protein